MGIMQNKLIAAPKTMIDAVISIATKEELVNFYNRLMEEAQQVPEEPVMRNTIDKLYKAISGKG